MTARSELSKVVATVRADLDALAAEVTAAVRAEVTVYGAEPNLTDTELAGAIRARLNYMLDWLDDPDAKPTDAVEVGTTGLDLGVPIADVLHAYRLGFARLWAALLAASRAGGPASTDALLSVVTDVWAFNNSLATALTEAYREEMNTRADAVARRRSALVADLIGGRVEEERASGQAMRLLESPSDALFVVVVAELASLSEPSSPSLEERLKGRGLAGAWTTEAGHEVGLLWRRPSDPSMVSMIDGVATARVGVSPEFGSLERAFRAAKFARAAMESLPSGSGIRQFEDSALGEIAIDNPEVARRFVRETLGGLLDLDDEDRAVWLETARVWLQQNCSANKAARVLFCHPNTVRYRIRRIEERLGVGLDQPNRLAEFATALELLKVLPELVDVGPRRS